MNPFVNWIRSMHMTPHWWSRIYWTIVSAALLLSSFGHLFHDERIPDDEAEVYSV